MEITGTMEGRGGFAEGDSPDSSVSIGARRKWTLTREAFDDLLAALDGDRERAAAKYLELRDNLVRFFEWRGCSFPDDHADEALNRVAKRIAAGEEIRNPAGYALGVARLLLLEIIKEQAREQVAWKESAEARENLENGTDSERRLDCLRDCLSHLSSDNRELIIQYYQGEKVAVLADPVFSENDPRLMPTQKTSGLVDQSTSADDLKRSASESGLPVLERLRFSRLEAEEISKLVGDKMKLKAFDFAANRALATSDHLSQYRIVHFATHGLNQ